MGWFLFYTGMAILWPKGGQLVSVADYSALHSLCPGQYSDENENLKEGKKILQK
jgi:hypothetical protein